MLLKGKGVSSDKQGNSFQHHYSACMYMYCVCLYVHVHVHTDIHIRTCTCTLCTRLSMHTRTTMHDIHIHVHVHARILIDMHTPLCCSAVRTYSDVQYMYMLCTYTDLPSFDAALSILPHPLTPCLALQVAGKRNTKSGWREQRREKECWCKGEGKGQAKGGRGVRSRGREGSDVAVHYNS